MIQAVRISALIAYTTVLSLILSTVVHAQSGGGDGAGGCEPGKLCNPLQSRTIPEFLLKIIDVLLVFAIPLIVIFIMYAGFQFVTAKGNTEQISSARTALLWAIVGGVIVVGAKIIVTVIQGTIQAF